MKTVEPTIRGEGYGASGTYTCPHCHGGLYRIPRRMTDRIQSLFVPVRRFRCNYLSCDWVGNLRVSKDDAHATELPDSAARSNPLLQRPASSRISGWLVANVVFVVAGIVAVVLAGTTNWLSDPQSARQELSEEQWLATAKVGGAGAKLGNTATVAPTASAQTKVAGQP